MESSIYVFSLQRKYNMNELEALNMLLRLIGSSPVNSVSTPHPDAANARTTLERQRKQVQRRGWWFNIDYNITYTPDSGGHIVVPSQLNSLVIYDKRFIQRGDKIYDKCNQTYVITEAVLVKKQIRILEWDDMPECVQEHAAYKAAAEFVRDELEDPQKESSLKESAGIAALNMKKQDLEEGQYNMFSQPRVVQARAGVQPYQRNNKRFYGDPDV